MLIDRYFELVYHVVRSDAIWRAESQFHGNAVLECEFLDGWKAKLTSGSALGEAVYLAMHLNLHREESYVGLDPVDSERRRRIFFLIYNADKYR